MSGSAGHLGVPGLERTGPHAAPSLALVVGAALLLAHAAIPAPLPLSLRMLSAVPGAVACVLWWRYFAGGNLERLPFLATAVTHVYLYWGLAAVTTRAEDLAGAGPRAWTGAVVATVVVTAGFLLAHPAGRRLGGCAAHALEACLPRGAPRVTPVVILPWLALCTLVHADVTTAVIPARLDFVVKTAGDYAPLLAAVAWADLRRGRRSPWLIGCTATLALAGLATGMMEAVVRPVLLAITLVVVLQRRVPWRFLGVGVLIVLVINPAKHRYRELAWQDATSGEARDHAARDPRVAAERWWTALTTTWSSADFGGESTSGLASRLNELGVNAVVFEQTPSAVPFDRGRAWSYLAVSLVPRFLYPDKPNFTEVYNDRFNVTFGFQTPEETETSTGAFPLVADGYWNLGWPGVVLVGLAAGLLVGVFAGVFRARTWASTAVATSSFVQMHADSSVALQALGVLQHVAGLAVVLWATWAVSAGVESARRSARRGGEPVGAP
jgi:hypothetical protein